MHEKRPRQIRPFSEEEIRQDVEKYRQKALELGATDAKMIPAEKTYVDPRVRFKCTVPKCHVYGTCAHCPPHSPEPEIIRDLVSRFRYALLAKIEVESSQMSGEGLGVTDESGNIVLPRHFKELQKSYRKLSDIVTEIESDAFYDGHYLAVSFAAGSCRVNYCNLMECEVLKGMPCRFALMSRPSMESSSMDVYRMASEAGWEIFPIGLDCNPANVPHGTLVGLVLVD